MSSKLPLGMYIGNPNGNDSGAEAEFDSHFDSFSSAIGQTPEFIDTFIDFSGSWSNVLSNAQWNAWSQHQSPVARDLTPVIAVPLGTNGDNGPDTLQQIAAGAHDDVYRGLAEAYRDQGYADVYMRIGWEMNGDFMRWSMGNTAESVDTWKAAFAHVADVLHGVSGIKVSVVWNPNLSNNNQIDVGQSYPGDDKVDTIGLDFYSTTYKYDASISDAQYYNYPSASQYHPTGTAPAQWGLADTIDFAKAHGKAVGIAETGVGVGDSNDLPATIAADFTAPEAPQLAFVNVWDVTTGEGDWQFSNGHNPGAAEAWAAAFAVGSDETSTGDAVPSAATNTPDETPATASPDETSDGAGDGGTSISTYSGWMQFLSPNANRAEAAWGPADITGDAGSDLYVVHPGDSALTVENFSWDKGDVLNISPSLRDALAQTQIDGGVVLTFDGDPQHTGNVFLKGMTSIDTARIDWS